MNLRVNDRPHVADGQPTLQELLAELGHTGKTGLAVAVNDAVIPRAGWAARKLAEGDRVLVIQATQGG